MLKRSFIVIGWILGFTLVPYLAGTYLLPFIFNIDIANENIYLISFLGLMLSFLLVLFIFLLLSKIEIAFNYIKYGKS